MLIARSSSGIFRSVRQMATAAKAQRPVSPHLKIYQPQLTWVMSIAHRATGAGLAAGIYTHGCYTALATSPVMSAQIVSGIYSVPLLAFVLKLGLSAPFTYHFYNGLRHLAWDWGYALSLKGVYYSGYAVQAATVVSTLALLAK